MELNTHIKKADELIQKILDDYGYMLQLKSGKISQVDVDLILDDLRMAYDVFKKISRLNLDNYIPVTHEPAPIKEDIKPESIINDTPKAVAVAEESFNPENDADQNNWTNESSLLDFETTQANTPLITVDIAAQEPDTTIELFSSSPNTPTPPETVADIFRKTEKEILANPFIQETTDNSISSRLQNQPISDLKSAININERFTFMTDLFGPSPKDYELVIDQLNNAPNLEEATKIYNLAKAKYNWDENDYSVKRLYEFVCRRHQM